MSIYLNGNNSKELRFIDSFKSMASSLKNLSNNLTKEKFINLSKYYQSDHLDFVIEKRCFIHTTIWITLINLMKKNYH